ncbi:MAG: MFS transporter [Nitrososphaera sp.]|uniref:Major facilitator superfamily MFS_1 n=1 Tax=Nitrososphaera gargensis (strain Ga9.2) TaxID=1237085 RepID=K0I7Y8_NITGG|nr:MFS transporter [Candidatus Nitrososphaera gargensis]AFU57386.1 major facilitator superfamily MFS_1 [Candidatus Nitrososphaera gargensis Ga9.2]
MISRAVLLVAICAAIVGVSYGMHSPIVPVFARDQLAADYSQVGLIGTINYLPYMFAPFFFGMLLDRLNKSYMLVSGVLLNMFSIFMLSTVQSVPEIMLYRTLAGVAHALFWPSAEVLVSTNTTPDRRVKSISTFIAAWILGFMVGPLIGKLILDVFNYIMLFQLAAAIMAAGMVPSMLLRRYGWPAVQKDLEVRAGTVQIMREVAARPTLSSVILYYAITFGVVLAVLPAYMNEASLTSQDIEVLFFLFGISRFATLMFVPRISVYGVLALALAVLATAIAMLLAFVFTSFLSFAIAIALVGLATSIFYPVTFSLVTRDTPSGQIGAKLGIYNALFGSGWTAGPIVAGLSSDAFGSGSPYFAFFVAGSILAGSIVMFKRR